MGRDSMGRDSMGRDSMGRDSMVGCLIAVRSNNQQQSTINNQLSIINYQLLGFSWAKL
jgi:hypothetical protein